MFLYLMLHDWLMKFNHFCINENLLSNYFKYLLISVIDTINYHYFNTKYKDHIEFGELIL